MRTRLSAIRIMSWGAEFIPLHLPFRTAVTVCIQVFWLALLQRTEVRAPKMRIAARL